MLLFSSADFFQNGTFFKKILSRRLSGLDPDQAWQNVGPDLGPKLFAKIISTQKKFATSRLRVTVLIILLNTCPAYVICSDNLGKTVMDQNQAQTEWKTLWILIRLLLQMSADLDLHYYSIDDIDKGKVTLVMLYIYMHDTPPQFFILLTCSIPDVLMQRGKPCWSWSVRFVRTQLIWTVSVFNKG